MDRIAVITCTGALLTSIFLWRLMSESLNSKVIYPYPGCLGSRVGSSGCEGVDGENIGDKWMRGEGKLRDSAGVAHTRGSYLLLKALSTTRWSCSSLCPHPLQFRTV